MTEKNWAGNHTYEATRLHKPETLVQVQELVAAASKVKVLGTRHCFNDIADFPGGDLISLERLTGIRLDRERRLVTVDGGVRYGELCEYLNREGFALHNMASLPHITVAGAVATATHGSGVRNGSLSTAVSGLEIVTAGGELVALSRLETSPQPSPWKGEGEAAGDRFAGAVVGLGALGVVSRLTLDVQPAYDMRQNVYENLPMDAVAAHFDEIESSAYSVSLFTDWRGDVVNQVWLKSRVTDGAALSSNFFGATAASGPRSPLPNGDPLNCTGQMGVPGPWHDRLPHFKYGFQPSNGDELQTEYFVPRRHTVAALGALAELADRICDLLWICEVRTIDADDHWMSPCYQRESVAFHFTWKSKWPEVRDLLPSIESALAPFDARPHWGKLFTMLPSRVQSLYPKLADFRQLVMEFDPEGKFRNPYLERYIFV